MSIRTVAGADGTVHHRTVHLAVFVGRFQPLHDGHVAVIVEALRHADYLTILVGSSGQPRSFHNPFTFDERKAMILAALPAADRARVMVQPLFDHLYNDGKWVVSVQQAVADAQADFGIDPVGSVTALIGHSKDGTSYYLRLFPQWASINVPGHGDLSSSGIRRRYFLNEEMPSSHAAEVPAAVHAFLTEFRHTDAFDDVRGEYLFVEAYRQPYAALPYPPVFVTVDACVVQSGHVLLVRRRARPGKGLWALPGGFIGPTERLEDAVIRELREETKIKVPEAVLRGSVVRTEVFDAPYRSARGRTITHASLIHLKPDVELPKVRGGDDAERARWWPIGDVTRTMMFEDHYSIISRLTSHL